MNVHHAHNWHPTGTSSGDPVLYHHHCPECDALGIARRGEIPDRVSPWREHYLDNARELCAPCLKSQNKQNSGGTKA